MTADRDDDLQPLDDEELTEKDTSYSPASEAETEFAQADGGRPPANEDIDRDAVKLTPGTGGPDDSGDVEVDPDDLNLPFEL